MLDKITAARPPMEEYLKDGAGNHYYDPEFLKDMQDLLSGRRAGHAFHHVMSGDAYKIWEQFTRAADTKYYPFNEEADLISSNPDWFRINAGLSVGEGSIVVELGTGSEYSAQKKTLPFIDAVQAQVYVGVDKSVHSAVSVVDSVHTHKPDIAVFMRLTDFNTQNLRIEWDELRGPIVQGWMDKDIIRTRAMPEEEPRRRILAQFGSTLGNIEGFIDDQPPIDKIVRYLSNYRSNMREGDVFFLGLDQNQDEGSLHNCYGSPFISKFSMEMLRRIKAELPVSPTFNPESFDYVRMWNPRNGLYFHGFNSKGNNEFALGNEKIRTPQNGKVSYVNAWKLKQEFLERAYRESGFRTIDRLDGPGNRIHIHALEAV